jgi:hypothetical protein
MLLHFHACCRWQNVEFETERTEFALRLLYFRSAFSRTAQAYKMMIGKPDGKNPLGRPRHRWADNVRRRKMMGRCGMD